MLHPEFHGQGLGNHRQPIVFVHGLDGVPPWYLLLLRNGLEQRDEVMVFRTRCQPKSIDPSSGGENISVVPLRKHASCRVRYHEIEILERMPIRLDLKHSRRGILKLDLSGRRGTSSSKLLVPKSANENARGCWTLGLLI